jgi:hypothetical protein
VDRRAIDRHEDIGQWPAANPHQRGEHADDAEFTDSGGASDEAPCSLAGDNFCFVGDIGSFFGFSSGVQSDRQRQQNSLLKSFKQVKKEKG